MAVETSVSKEAQKTGTTRLGGALAQASKALSLSEVVEAARNCGVGGVCERSFAAPAWTAEVNPHNNHTVGDRRPR